MKPLVNKLISTHSAMSDNERDDDRCPLCGSKIAEQYIMYKLSVVCPKHGRIRESAVSWGYGDYD